MITSICMNPSMDKTIEIDGFNYGGMNRVKTARYDASGKAVNVAIVLARLGAASHIVGLNYRQGGETIEYRLGDEHVTSEFIWHDGRLRENIKARDMKTGIITEINESGEAMSPEQTEAAKQLALDAGLKSDYLVLTGSLPKGCPDDFYADIIRNTDCRCVLDCEGAKLNAGIAAHPFLIKPNQYELELLIGRKLNSREEIKAAALEQVDKGVEWVLVSMGGDGAMLVGRDTALFAPALDVPVRSTVGAGDSMVAGMVYGFLSDGSPETALRWSVACASASVMTEGTQLIDMNAVYDLPARVEIAAV